MITYLKLKIQTDKYQIITITLLIIGISIIYMFVIPELMKIPKEQENFQEQLELKNNRIDDLNSSYTLTIIPINATDNIVPFSLEFDINKKLIISHEDIEIRIMASKIKSDYYDIDSMVFYLSSEKIDFSGHDSLTLHAMMAPTTKTKFTLLESDSIPEFYTIRTIDFDKEQDVYLNGYYTIDNSFEYFHYDSKLFHVYPLLHKIQMENAMEQKLSNSLQIITNHTLIGLTWLGIASLFLITGVNVLIRKHIG